MTDFPSVQTICTYICLVTLGWGAVYPAGLFLDAGKEGRARRVYPYFITVNFFSGCAAAASLFSGLPLAGIVLILIWKACVLMTARFYRKRPVFHFGWAGLCVVVGMGVGAYLKPAAGLDADYGCSQISSWSAAAALFLAQRASLTARRESAAPRICLTRVFLGVLAAVAVFLDLGVQGLLLAGRG